MTDWTDYSALNAAAWDQRAKEGNIWTLPISQNEFNQARQGNWHVLLTFIKPVPKSWFPPLPNLKILGLASGGGQQCPIFAALGADVTVFDISAQQLETELIMAERQNYPINLVKGDMTKPLPFENETFDLIFHPVSNCYIRDVTHVWKEAYRILKPGGSLLAGFNNPSRFLFNLYNGKMEVANKLPYDPITLGEEETRLALERDGALEFSHSLTTQIGGQIQAGFTLVDMYEDTEDGELIGQYMPCYIATRAIKK